MDLGQILGLRAKRPKVEKVEKVHFWIFGFWGCSGFLAFALDRPFWAFLGCSGLGPGRVLAKIAKNGQNFGFTRGRLTRTRQNAFFCPLGSEFGSNFWPFWLWIWVKFWGLALNRPFVAFGRPVRLWGWPLGQIFAQKRIFALKRVKFLDFWGQFWAAFGSGFGAFALDRPFSAFWDGWRVGSGLG